MYKILLICILTTLATDILKIAVRGTQARPKEHEEGSQLFDSVNLGQQIAAWRQEIGSTACFCATHELRMVFAFLNGWNKLKRRLCNMWKIMWNLNLRVQK